MSGLILELTSGGTVHYAEEKGDLLGGLYSLKELAPKTGRQLLIGENRRPQTRIKPKAGD